MTDTIWIAHAGGAFNGYTYTNACEAFYAAEKAGFKYAEIDFCRTSDGDYASLHDWRKTYTRLYSGRILRDRKSADFLKAESRYGGTQMTLKRGFDEVFFGTRMTFLIDAKHDNLKLCTRLYRKYKKQNERIIPQAFTFAEYDCLKTMFPSVLLILYRSRRSVEKVEEFAFRRKPFGIAVSLEKSAGITFAGQLSRLGVHVFCHTVNDKKTAEQLKKRGFTGFYTDLLDSEGKIRKKTA